jgi:glycosyltransferase involved in cell wall biosynthesis
VLDKNMENGMSSGRSDDDRILVAMPVYRSEEWLRRAVDSVLGQTHANLQIVVINDGDEKEPWHLLDDIQDDRLWRLSLPQNRGMYFTLEAALRATDCQYMLVQDSDDWSDPRRAELLLDNLAGTDYSASLSAQRLYTSEDDDEGKLLRFAERLSKPPDADYRFVASHHGLYKTSVLRSIGGYYAGFRVEHDNFVVHVLHLLGRFGYVDEALYTRIKHPESLTRASTTGRGSPYRVHARATYTEIYRRALEQSLADPSLARASIRDDLAAVVRARMTAAESLYMDGVVAFLRDSWSRPSPGVLRHA